MLITFTEQHSEILHFEKNPSHLTAFSKENGNQRLYFGYTDLKEAAEVMQGALGPQKAPGQDGADLFAHGVEVSDEAVRHLRPRGELTETTIVCSPSAGPAIVTRVRGSDLFIPLKTFCGGRLPSCAVSSASSLTSSSMPPPVKNTQVRSFK